MILLAHGEGEPAGGLFPPWEWHPATVHFPLAFLLGAVALDLYARWVERPGLARVATGMMTAGVALGLVAATTGAVAFFTVPAHTDEAHRLMYWHLGLNAAALALFAAVVIARWRVREPGAGVRVAGLLAAGLLGVGGFLGGRIVYRGGAGVDPAILSPDLRHGHDHDAGSGRPDPASKPDAGNPVPKDGGGGHHGGGEK
ncbi:MAG: DUF2231 domain-containing protein [Gemmataceae bacterium]|nr:DUF2231 domain-containing protein [Gemmataceae bacterium]